MQRARAFFFVSAGLFLLALGYHLGATSATAQVGTAVEGVVSDGNGRVLVMTPNGDVYGRSMGGTYSGSMDLAPPAFRLGNFWSGSGPTPASAKSWGHVKVDHAGQVTPTNH